MGLSAARTLWKEWGLRIMVMLSLLVQILLTLITCSRRKRFRSLWLRAVLWFSYSSANGIAVFALGIVSYRLGVLSDKGPVDEPSKLTALWAPILLFFLGGPDSITALSLEDNELWMRYLLYVAAQTVAALYIIVMAWTHSYLSYLSLVMLLAAIIKWGEKTFVLWKASNENLTKSLHYANPGPNYPKFMEEYCIRQEEGFIVRFLEISEVHEPVDPSTAGPHNAKDILRAHALFPSFMRLFVDLILSDHDRDVSIIIFKPLQMAKDAFRIVEIELHFVYQLLHTKAKWLYTPYGFIARLVTNLLTLTVLIVFSIISKEKRKSYSEIDRILTILLLATITILEFYSLGVLWLSYRINDWRNTGESLIFTRMAPSLQLSMQPRWFNIMGQFCLVGFCIKEDTRPIISKLLELVNFELTWHTYHVDISNDLRDFIYSFLRKRMEDPNHKYMIGTWSPEMNPKVFTLHNFDNDLSWSLQLEFDQCILVWHIATELWCEMDKGIQDFYLDWSKLMSRYMVYLLVNCPFMFPRGIAHIRIRDTVAEAERFFGSDVRSINAAYEMLGRVEPRVDPSRVKGSISKSVLFEAQRLAWGLRRRDDLPEEFNSQKWEMVADVWLHFLLCAAKQCSGSSHAKQLGRGGELLTQVWMLMAHLGLTDHFQMRQVSAIARIVSE